MQRAALLRRTGIVPNAGALYGPGSAAHHAVKNGALRRVRGTGACWGDALALPAPAMAGVLGQVAVGGLFADIVFFVVAVAFGGVERDGWRAAGALVALVVVGNGRDGFVER